MKSKNWLSLNYFLQYAVQGVFFQYWMIYLTGIKKLTVLDASIVFSMVYLGRVISGVFFSSLIIKKFGMKNSFRIVAISGLCVSLLYLGTNDKLSLIIVTFLFGLTFFNLTPITETSSSLFLKFENIDYGRVRVYGSLSFMLIGMLVGGFISYISNIFILYTMILLVLIYVIFTFLPTPKLLTKIDKVDSNTKSNKKSFVWMKNDKNAIILILTFFFLQISHAAYNNYSVLYLENMNITFKWLTGVIVNISIVSEILFFTFSRRLLKNISAQKLLIFSCLVATFRWFILGLFENVYIFAIMQVLHAVTFALAQLTFILLLNSKFSEDKTLDMQNLYSAVGFQLSAFLGMYIVGSIWEISTNTVFFVSSAIAFISFILAKKLNFK